MSQDRIESRRAFMKKFGKNAGTLVLMAPFIAMTDKEGVPTSKMDEPSKNDCGDTCSKTCRNNCYDFCSYSCNRGCKGTCKYSCSGGCRGTCEYSCMSATRLD